MAQEIADSKLIDTWSSDGLKVEPDISKIIEGWQLGEQPPHEYMNWLQNTFGSKLNHILKNGVASWSNTTPYLAGATVQHNGNVWLCKTTNTNSAPTDANANWKRIITVESLTTALGGYVATTGDQTISGVKTFSSSPLSPIPTINSHVANKEYVDDVAGGYQDFGIGTFIDYTTFSNFYERALRITIPPNSFVTFPDLPSKACDILVYGITDGTGSESGFVGRFHKTNNVWYAQNIYGATGTGISPSIEINGNLPSFKNNHPAAAYNFSYKVSINTQTSSVGKPFKFYGEIATKDYVDSVAVTPDASTTVKGIVELATDAEAQAGTDDLRAITPLKLFNALKGSNQSLSANGYQKLHGGLIIQWGTNTAGAVTFPIAFPTNCSGIYAGINTTVAVQTAKAHTPTVLNKTTTSFTLGYIDYSSPAVTNYSWLAIGY